MSSIARVDGRSNYMEEERQQARERIRMNATRRARVEDDYEEDEEEGAVYKLAGFAVVIVFAVCAFYLVMTTGHI